MGKRSPINKAETPFGVSYQGSAWYLMMAAIRQKKPKVETPPKGDIMSISSLILSAAANNTNNSNDVFIGTMPSHKGDLLVVGIYHQEMNCYGETRIEWSPLAIEGDHFQELLGKKTTVALKDVTYF